MTRNQIGRSAPFGDLSRRRFIGTSASAAAGFMLLPGCTGTNRSKFKGVQIGAISYSYRDISSSAEDILGYLLEAGLGSVELMGNTIEQFAGIPEGPPRPQRGVEMTDDQRAEYQEARERAAEELHLWRLSPPMEKFEALRRMYNDEGVDIHIAKLGSHSWPEGEIDYAFNVARALGARGISMEISVDAARIMAPHAERHGLYTIFHQHGQVAEPDFSFDDYLDFGSSLMLNFDVGHAFGFTGRHPNETIERYHDRIVSIHLKDKTGPDSEPANRNMPWGEGETPIADILLLIRDKGWPIHVDIELEYPVPDGSTSAAEVRRCVDFCREILS
ncbi:sugar phosphate isomerase/epimerase family protein [Gemmatimonadota bacterium]